MMTRTEAFEYLNNNYYIDEMSKDIFDEYMDALMNTPHKPWCRTRMRHVAPEYGSECTCGEDND